MTAVHKNLQSILLPSGRTLAFAEFGKPNGRPIIYLHGFPTCRLEAMAFDTPARRANVRLIAPDRPGIGHSSFTSGRKILDHVDDVKALSQHLQIEKFAVLGVSGGAPYALVCASMLPKEKLTGVGILSGMGTYEKEDLGLVPMASRVTGWLANNTPRSLGFITNILVAVLQRVVKWRWVQERIDQMIDNEGTSRNKLETNVIDLSMEDTVKERSRPAAKRERLLNMVFEPFRKGSMGVVHEAAILSQSWGFNLEEVDYPVVIWHGAKDANAPIDWVRAMAERIPNAKLHEYKEETHGGVVKHIDTVFAQLTEG